MERVRQRVPARLGDVTDVVLRRMEFLRVPPASPVSCSRKRDRHFDSGNSYRRQVVLPLTASNLTGQHQDLDTVVSLPFIVGVAPDDLCAQSGKKVPGQMHEMGIMFRMGNVDSERLFAHLHDHPEEFVTQPVALMDIDEAQANVRNHEMACFEIKRDGMCHHAYISGQAAGTAAALCIATDVAPRDIDFCSLRAKLAEDGAVL